MKYLVLTAVSTAVTGLVAGIVAAAVALSSSIEVGLAVRGALALAAVAWLAHTFTARAVRAGSGRPAMLVLAGALAGFFLDPMTWNGRTAAAQLFAEPGPATVAVDLVCWIAAAAVGTGWATSRVRAPERVSTPYG